MTMHPIDRMAAIMAEIDNDTAAQILRQMVSDGPELTTATEFLVAASHVAAARKVQDLLEAQEWDDEQVDAFIKTEGLAVDYATWLKTVITGKDGVEHSGHDLRAAIRAYKDHKEAASVKAKAAAAKTQSAVDA